MAARKRRTSVLQREWCVQQEACAVTETDTHTHTHTTPTEPHRTEIITRREPQQEALQQPTASRSTEPARRCRRCRRICVQRNLSSTYRLYSPNASIRHRRPRRCAILRVCKIHRCCALRTAHHSSQLPQSTASVCLPTNCVSASLRSRRIAVCWHHSSNEHASMWEKMRATNWRMVHSRRCCSALSARENCQLSRH